MLSSSHRRIVKQPSEKPNSTELFLTNGVQGSLMPSLSYTTLSCNVPPILIFNGEKATINTIKAKLHDKL